MEGPNILEVLFLFYAGEKRQYISIRSVLSFQERTSGAAPTESSGMNEERVERTLVIPQWMLLLSNGPAGVCYFLPSPIIVLGDVATSFSIKKGEKEIKAGMKIENA